MKKLFVLCICLLATTAQAQKKFSTLPNASLPPSTADTVIGVQNGNDVRFPASPLTTPGTVGDIVTVGPNSTQTQDSGTTLSTVANTTAKIKNIFNPVSDHSAPTNGTSDATAAFAASLSDCSTAGGGVVVVPPYQFQISSASLTVPIHCVLEGLYAPGPDAGGSKYTTTQPAILLNGSFSINMSSDSALRHLAVLNPAVIVLPVNTIQRSIAYYNAFAGTAINIGTGAASVILEDVFVIGYGTCVNILNTGRPSLLHLQADCNTPIIINNVQDVGLLSDINLHTFMPAGANAELALSITGVVDNGSGQPRLTVSTNTNNLLTGNTAFIYNVGGFTGANGKWPITVVDSTHVDLLTDATAPSTTGIWNSGSNRVIVASGTGLYPGMGISGTGIAGSSTISFVDWQAGVIYLNQPTTAGGNGAALTFSNGVYTSGGTLRLSADTHNSIAIQIIGTDFVMFNNAGEYGWETGVSITGNSPNNILSNFWCDSEQVFDPYSVCVSNASSAAGNQWNGGSVASQLVALYSTGFDMTMNGIAFTAGLVGSVPISMNGSRVRITNSIIYNASGVTINPGQVLFDIGPSAAWTGFSNDRFLLASLAVEPSYIGGSGAVSLGDMAVDWSAQFYNWLYSPPNDNLLCNPGFVLDQQKEGGSYGQGGANAPQMDCWYAQVTGISTQGWTSGRSSSTAPGAANEWLITITGTGTITSAGFNLFEQRIEAGRIASLGFGTINAQPLSLSFYQKCSVAGTYSINLVNASNNRALVEGYTLPAAVWTLETFAIPGDIGGTWTAVSNRGMVLTFVMSSGASNQTSTLGSWLSGQTLTAATGQVDLGSNSGATCEIAQVKLEQSVHPTVFVARNPATELTLAQRYYVKSFIQGTAVGTNKGVGTGESLVPSITSTTGTVQWPSIGFPGPMVSTPAMTFYNPAAANANCRDETATADGGAGTAVNTTTNGFQATCTAAGTGSVNDTYGVHWSADSRL